MIIFAFFFVQSAPEYINIDNSSFLALDKSDHDGGTQWTCTENHFWSEKAGSATMCGKERNMWWIK